MVFTKLARNEDPETSHDAGAAMEGSLTQVSQQELAAALVKAYPGSTARELSTLLNHEDRDIPHRRLPECEAKGMVKRGPPRICEVGGRRAHVWLPA